MASREIKIHLRQVRPSVFGSELLTSLCNRFACTDDGMNLTDNRDEVTCFFCKRALTYLDKRRRAA